MQISPRKPRISITISFFFHPSRQGGRGIIRRLRKKRVMKKRKKRNNADTKYSDWGPLNNCYSFALGAKHCTHAPHGISERGLQCHPTKSCRYAGRAEDLNFAFLFFSLLGLAVGARRNWILMGVRTSRGEHEVVPYLTGIQYDMTWFWNCIPDTGKPSTHDPIIQRRKKRVNSFSYFTRQCPNGTRRHAAKL